MQPEAVAQMKKASGGFRGSSELESCKNIWNYLKGNILYVADGAEQVVKLPSALIREKDMGADCKSFALFTSAVLSNLKIPHYLIYTSYDQSPTPTHVYCETKSGIIIDAVYHTFNQEKESTYKYKEDMNLRGIAGTNPASKQYSDGSVYIGSVGSVNKVSGAVHAAQKINPALVTARNAFLLMVRTNILGLASVINFAWAKSASQNPGRPGDSPAKSATLTRWYNLGGDIDSLNAAIRAGEQKKAQGNKFVLWLAKKDRTGAKRYAQLLKETIDHYVNSRKIDIREPKRVRGIGAEPASTGTLTTIITALPVLLAILQQLNTLAGKTPSDSEFDMLSRQYGDGTDLTPEESSFGGGAGGSIMAGGITPILIAAGLAAALFLTGKKSK